MRGNWIKMTATAAAANANPTTLAAVSNYPTYADVFGTSGTRVVEYEFDDGVGHFEAGIGTLTLSTLSLSRDFPSAAYDAGATPKYVNAPAARLATFSGTVNVSCAPLASSFVSTHGMTAAFGTSINGLGNGFFNVNMSNNLEQQFNLQGWRAYSPFRWDGARPINSCSMFISTAGAGKVLVGLMEIGKTSLNLIANFATSGGFDATVTGPQTLVAPTNFPEVYVPPGNYVLQVLPTVGGSTPKVYAAGQYASGAASILGYQSSSLLPITLMLDSAGATTLATSFSGAPNGGAASSTQVPNIVFGMG